MVISTGRLVTSILGAFLQAGKAKNGVRKQKRAKNDGGQGKRPDRGQQIAFLKK